MRHTVLSFITILFGTTFIMAQNVEAPGSDAIISLKEPSMFSNCFKDFDKNGDGIVDATEAAAATILVLDKGGRSNVIDNYDFLKYFPNLTAFGVGNTPLEEIDLHNLKKLEKLHVGNATWLKKVILAEGCKVEITGKDEVKVEYR